MLPPEAHRALVVAMQLLTESDEGFQSGEHDCTYAKMHGRIDHVALALQRFSSSISGPEFLKLRQR